MGRPPNNSTAVAVVIAAIGAELRRVPRVLRPTWESAFRMAAQGVAGLAAAARDGDPIAEAERQVACGLGWVPCHFPHRRLHEFGAACPVCGAAV